MSKNERRFKRLLKGLFQATLAVSSFALVVWGLATLLRSLHVAAPGQSGMAADSPAAGSQKNGLSRNHDAQTTRGYSFKRLVHASMGSKELVELRLSGSLWVTSNSADLSPGEPNGVNTPVVALVQLISVEAVGEGRGTPQGPGPVLPLAQIHFTPKGALSPTVEVAAGASPELRDAAARFSMDVIDQYRFFATTDLQGHYEARIATVATGRYRKTKVRYLDAPYASGTISSSKHELKMAADGWPARIAGAETVALGTDQFAVRSETNYVIEAMDPAAALAGRPSVGEWTTVAVNTDGNRAPRSRRRAAAGGTDLSHIPELPELLATLRSGALVTGASRLAWFKGAVDRLDVQTGRLDSVREALADSRGTPEQFQVLVGALAGSVTPDAAATLLDAYRDDRYSADNHRLIMNGWIASDTPLSGATTAFLSTVATDPDAAPADAQNAMLALGSQLGKLGDGASVDAGGAPLEALLIAKLAQAGSEADTVAALDAMGNAGLADFLAPIDPFLSNPSAHVRAHAYLALRLIPGTTTTARLSSGLSDPSSEVQDSVQMAENIRQAGVPVSDN